MTSEQKLLRGSVKWFDKAKGYGFISGPDNNDVMIHYKEIDMSGYRYLFTGDIVEYTAIQSENGWKATYAKPLIATEDIAKAA